MFVRDVPSLLMLQMTTKIKEFVIVEFLKEAAVKVVPQTWLQKAAGKDTVSIILFIYQSSLSEYVCACGIDTSTEIMDKL